MMSRRAPPIVVVTMALAGVLPGCISTTYAPLPFLEAAPPPAPAVRAPPNAYVHPPPVLVLENLDGAEAARTRAVFAPVAGALAECHAGASGVIRVTLAAHGGKARYTLDPSTSLGPQARRCVLETLSTIEIEGISGDVSPSARPSGFTAQFRLEW